MYLAFNNPFIYKKFEKDFLFERIYQVVNNEFDTDYRQNMIKTNRFSQDLYDFRGQEAAEGETEKPMFEARIYVILALKQLVEQLKINTLR